MYKVRTASELVKKLCNPVYFEFPNRTKMKVVDTCMDTHPCEETPYRPKTGILMLHPGEATTMDQIRPFLIRVSKDKTYKLAAPSITTRSGFRPYEEVCSQYEQIGGRSPLFKWASKLATAVAKRLDKDLRRLSPFKALVGFRYASPLVTKALKEFQIDDVKHLILFSLEPHFYCQKTGPCFDGIYKYYKKHELPAWSWTVVDRWGLTYLLCGVFAQTIQYELDSLPAERRRQAVILFAANGLLVQDVRKGELYLYEVGTTVHNIMQILNFNNDFCLTWLPPISCLEPIKPSLEDTLCKLYQDGRRTFIVVPVSYACECLDTLYEIDIAIIQKYRELWGCEAVILRSSAPNNHVFMINAAAQVIQIALQNEVRGSAKFLSQCHGCKMITCSNQRKFFKKILK